MHINDASVALVGIPLESGPAGTPFSVMVRHAGLPKQPSCDAPWPGQKRPPGSVSLTVPVVSGDRVTLIVPMCLPSQQSPPPIVHGQLLGAQLPGLPGQGVPGDPTPPVGQSRVYPVELVVVQGSPARGPRSQVPVPGLLGEPVAEQRGQGCARLPVI